MNVPANLKSRVNKICDSFIDVNISVTLRKNSQIVELKINVDNHAEDHRVRVLIPSLFKSKCYISDNQFGSISRLARDPAEENWIEEKWTERPDAIYPFLSYVTQDTENGIGVLTNSVREFELVGNEFEIIAITLFRSVGVLGKEELLRRPGRPSGIRMETPDSQMKGMQTYDLALTTNKQHIGQMAKEYTTPLVTYNKMPYNAMKLNAPLVQTPYHFSLFKLNNSDVTLSVVKKEEEGKGLLVRLYNGTNNKQSVDLVQIYKLQMKLHLTKAL